MGQFINITPFGRTLADDASASDARDTLGLGTLATQSGTFSGSSSGTNTGDNATNSQYSGLVSNATHTGDAAGATALTLATVNSNVGAFTNASITVNAKGLVTAASSGTGGGLTVGTTTITSGTTTRVLYNNAGVVGEYAITGTGSVVMSNSPTLPANGAASAPGLNITGTPFVGTGTTSFPLVYLNETGATASTTLSTSGTYIGVNASGSGDLMNLMKGGASKLRVANDGTITLAASGSLYPVAAGGANGQYGWSVGGGATYSYNARHMTCFSSYIGFGSGTRLCWGNGDSYDNVATNYPDVTFGRYATGVLSVESLTTSGFTGISKPASLRCGQYSTTTTAFTIVGIASRTAPLVQLQTSAGASLGNVGGSIKDNFASVSSTSTDGTFDDLYTFTTVANTLANNGDCVRWRVGMKFVGHATALRNPKVVFAGTTIADFGAGVTAANADGVIDVLIERVSSTVVRYVATLNAPGFLVSAAIVPPIIGELTGLTLTGTNILKITGAASGTGVASGDITAYVGKMWRDEFGS